MLFTLLLKVIIQCMKLASSRALAVLSTQDQPTI